MKANPIIEHLNLLKDHIQPIAVFSEEDWEEFFKLWKTVKIPKRRVLTRQGEIEPYLYFVIEGVQRIYHLSEEGKETTIIFSYPHSFSGVLDSALTNSSSEYYFETLSESILLKASASEFLELANKRPAISQFIRIALAHNIKGLLTRLVEIQSLKAEEKFRFFMARSPHMLHIVPHRYLANYLGIDPTNFSKFINKIII